MVWSGIVSRGLGVSTTLSILLLMTCIIGSNEAMAQEEVGLDLEKISVEQWDRLNKKRIFFGHHSVGYNILDGVDMVATKRPSVKVNVVKLDGPSELGRDGQGLLSHGKVGDNFDPRSKIDDFASWIDKGVGGNVDVAFMKFCYVDIGTQTDLKELFNHYTQSLADLKAKYPTTTFVHFTVPLMSEKTGLAKWKHKLKGVVKKVLGKNEFYENQNKFKFNEMIRAEYNGKEPVFDLAAIESTYPDGTRSTFSSEGENIESMVPEFTDDGGHLTPVGKEIVAGNLLFFLANLE